MKRVLFFLSFLLLLAGCEPETILTVPSTPLEFTQQGGSISLPFVANKVWNVTPSATWCKVSPSSGDGSGKNQSNATVSITCDPNTDYDSRTCTLTIICQEASATVTVKQAAANGLVVSQTDFNVASKGEQIAVNVLSNVEFTATSEASWIKVVSSKGLSSHTLTLSVEANETYDDRTGTVVVKDASGALSTTITVNQVAATALIVSQTEFDLSPNHAYIEVTVSTNVEFTATSQNDWIKVVSVKGLTNHILTITTEDNKTGEARTGTVVVKDVSGTLSTTITIHQAQNDVLEVTADQETRELSEEAHTLTFTVKSNVEYVAYFEDPVPDWIKIVKTKGVETNQIVLEVAANNTLQARAKNLIVCQKDGDVKRTFFIEQYCRKDIVLSEENVELPWEGLFSQSVSLFIDASVDYSFTPDEASEPYIEAINSYPHSASSLEWSIVVKPNDDFVERTFHIIAQSDDKSITRTLTIKQLAPEIKIKFNGQPDGSTQMSMVGEDAWIPVYVYPEELLDYGYEITVKEPASGPMPIRLEEETEVSWPQWKVYSLCEGQSAVTFKLNKTGASATLNWDVVDHYSADPKTRQALVALGVDANYNGRFEEEEIAAVKKLKLSGLMKNVYDLNQFHELEELTLEDMPLLQAETWWDFDMTPLAKLKKLAIHGTRLLQAIYVADNKDLVELDLSNNPDNHILSEVYTHGLPKLETVIFSNTPFKEWGAYDNPALKRIEADNCGMVGLGAFGDNLEYVSARNNQLTTADFDGPNLKEVHMDGNKIEEVFLLDKPALEILTVNNNALKLIDSPGGAPNLRVLECANNQLKSLELQDNPKLKELRCLDNPMDAIMIRSGQVFSVFEVPTSATIYEVASIIIP